MFGLLKSVQGTFVPRTHPLLLYHSRWYRFFHSLVEISFSLPAKAR